MVKFGSRSSCYVGLLLQRVLMVLVAIVVEVLGSRVEETRLIVVWDPSWGRVAVVFHHIDLCFKKVIFN